MGVWLLTSNGGEWSYTGSSWSQLWHQLGIVNHSALAVRADPLQGQITVPRQRPRAPASLQASIWQLWYIVSKLEIISQI